MDQQSLINRHYFSDWGDILIIINNKPILFERNPTLILVGHYYSISLSSLQSGHLKNVEHNM